MKRFWMIVILVILGSGVTVAAVKHQHAKGLPKPSHSKKGCAADIASCPDAGCGAGGDTRLNTKKNRKDMPAQGSYQPMTFEDFLHLEEERPTQWTTGQLRNEVEALGEDTPVALAGYLIGAHPGSPETCNCGLSGEANNDYHINLVERPGDRLWNSIVVEMTPRVRPSFPQWTLQNIQGLITDINNPPLVRVSGYLLFDSQHVSRSGGPRITIWEVHPVTKLEVCSGTDCTVDSDSGWQDIAQSTP